MRRNAPALLIGLALASLSACARAQARTPAAVPVLDTPAPPPRLVIPVAVEPPPAPPAPPATPERPATGAPTRTVPPARTTPPPTTPPVTEAPPPPVLQTVPSVAELEARAKERLDRAEKDLAKVSRAALGRDARDQYDSAVRFISMAKDAIGAKNFVYAAYCAEKAAALAGLLGKFDPDEPEVTVGTSL